MKGEKKMSTETTIKTEKPFVGYFAKEYKGRIIFDGTYNPKTQQWEGAAGYGPTVWPTHCGQGEIDDERPCD